ncbi:MAG TPA: hypothetical protein VGN26_15465 [Armatimonadota bacterium]
MARERESFLTHFLSLTDEQEKQVASLLHKVRNAVLLLVLVILAIASTGWFKEQERKRQAQRLVELSGSFEKAVRADGYDLSQYFGGPDVRPRWGADRGVAGRYLVYLRYTRDGKEFVHYWRVNAAERVVQPVEGPSWVAK